MLIYDPEDTYWNCVCLLLPGGKATLVDTDFFERYAGERWQVMGEDVVFRTVRYTVIANPTAWKRNQKERVRYRFESLPRLVLQVPYDRMADHISRIRLDNRRSNLRVATGSQNAMNRKGVAGKTSRYKGVHWNKKEKRWVARVTYEGNKYHLGTFTIEDEAALAYNAFIKAHVPEHGYLNPISTSMDDEPTSARKPPQKRRSKLKKLTPKEQKTRKMRVQLERMKRTAARHSALRKERLAARKPMEWDDVVTPPWMVRIAEMMQSANR